MRILKPSSLLILALGTAQLASAQAPDSDVMQRIRDEGLNHSQVMQTLSYVSDVIGPRLTGSPGLKRANEWTEKEAGRVGIAECPPRSLGPFGRGWQLEKFSCQVVEPLDIPLISFPKAWSPSIRGQVTADVVNVDINAIGDLDQYKGKLKGKIILMGGIRPLEAHFTPDGTRFTDEQLEEMTQPIAQAGGQRRPAGGPQPARRPANFSPQELKFFMDEGAIAVLDGSRGDEGTIYVQSAAVPAASMTPQPSVAGQPPRRGPSVWDKTAPKTIPQITVSSEHFNRMVRMIQAGENLKINLELKTSFFDKDLMAYNTVAEIPGSDLKDELVMVGGHMDSWHAGTGATDNGAGLAVAMEAVRILKSLNLQPRRTIRIALWSGEEEGLYGSRNYVAQHVGSFPALANGQMSFGGGANPDRGPLTKGADYDRISAYFNLDNGTGKIRGIYCQGNEAVMPIFTDWLKPFHDLGAETVTLRNTGSTDHISFDSVGVPGFEFIQDVIEYGSHTHHSNQDVFDRVQGDDLKQAAVVEAAFLYNAAMRDEKLPRKPAG